MCIQKVNKEMRSTRNIALVVASSGIAVTLLPGDRTACQ